MCAAAEPDLSSRLQIVADQLVVAVEHVQAGHDRPHPLFPVEERAYELVERDLGLLCQRGQLVALVRVVLDLVGDLAPEPR
jgi:hypothetical protein